VNRNDTETVVRACVREVAPEADLATLPPDADLRESLYLDSLDFLALVELLSERTGQRIDEDDYPRLASLASTVDFLSTPH
jgi:acyl carrier protein